jgi:hypothetical protein
VSFKKIKGLTAFTVSRMDCFLDENLRNQLVLGFNVRGKHISPAGR